YDREEVPCVPIPSNRTDLALTLAPCAFRDLSLVFLTAACGSEEAFQLLKTTFSRLQDEHLKTQVGLELVRVSFQSKGVRSSRRNSAHPSKRQPRRPSCSLRGVSDLFGPRRQGSCYAEAGGAPVSADAPDVGPSFGKSG